ncbi:MAG: hypothetical protein LBH76_10690 [Propionibacteriaceae bacterium]|jgi:predicted transcriptional regulator|nr:hypothetical protein [Propionibacteriaceae bacterium]
MRTTITLPEDLHHQVSSIARDSHRTFSDTIAMIVRRGLGADPPAQVRVDPATGRAFLEVGRSITAEDVRSLDDDG